MGLGKHLMPHPAVEQAPGWWGMIFTLIFNAAFFASLAFGYVFLWMIAPNWPPPAFVRPDLISPLVTAAALMVGGGASILSVAANRRQRAEARQFWLLAAAAAGVVASCGFLAVPIFLAPDPTEHAYGAAVLMLAAYGVLHASLSAIGSGFAFLRARRGFIAPLRSLDIRNASLLWSYTTVTGLMLVALIHLMPIVAGG